MSSTVLGAGWNIKDTRLLQGGCGRRHCPRQGSVPCPVVHMCPQMLLNPDVQATATSPCQRSRQHSAPCTALLTSSLEIPDLRPRSEPASCLPTQLQSWGAAPHLFLSHCSQSPRVTCEQSPKGDTREWSPDFTWAMDAGVWVPPVPS